MIQYDPVLKMYAENGLRTVEDWTAHGRDIVSGATPRLGAPHQGAFLQLYSRDQTRIRITPRRVPT
jgi:hypothetical protein